MFLILGPHTQTPLFGCAGSAISILETSETLHYTSDRRRVWRNQNFPPKLLLHETRERFVQYGPGPPTPTYTSSENNNAGRFFRVGKSKCLRTKQNTIPLLPAMTMTKGSVAGLSLSLSLRTRGGGVPKKAPTQTLPPLFSNGPLFPEREGKKPKKKKKKAQKILRVFL